MGTRPAVYLMAVLVVLSWSYSLEGEFATLDNIFRIWAALGATGQAH